MPRTAVLLAVALVGFAGPLPAADPAPDTDRLAALFRDLLLANLPDPITESKRGWGHQKEVVIGLKWRGVRPEPQKAVRNDGHWQKVSTSAIDPAKSLALGIRDLKQLDPGRVSFEAMLGLDVRLTYEQQAWKSGARLYAGETRARCRAALRLRCEVTNRLEPRPGAVLPDAVFRVKVTEAEIFYTDLVCEHTLGIDGPAAKKLGEVVHAAVTAVKPSLEKDLLAKANAAVVRAADTKEVRVEFDKLLAGKVPAVSRTK